MVVITAAVAAPAPGQDRAPGAGATADDPAALFDAVVERYRSLSVYEDVADVVEVVQRQGRPAQRVETRIMCRLAGGSLEVTTPSEQVREGMGLAVSIDGSPAMEALVQRYNLWLAPHMVLHFAEDPLAELRAGVPEGFVPAAAEAVVRDERRLLRLELHSRSQGEAPRANFQFWVDPADLLIVRVEGRQRLPDGASYRTSLRITPVHPGGA